MSSRDEKDYDFYKRENTFSTTKPDQNGSNSSNNNDDAKDSKGSLLKRKDYLETDEHAKSHPNRTYYYKRYHDLDEVIETCTKKLQEDPKNLKALFLRGSSYSKKGALEAAIKDLSLVLINQPNHIECMYTRGIAFFKMGKHNDAITDLSTVLNHNPEHVNAAFARAACYNKMGMLAQAIEDYNFALFKDEAINSPEMKNNPANRNRANSGANTFDSPYNLNRSGGYDSMFSPGNSISGGGADSGLGTGRSKRLESLDASGIFSLYESNAPGGRPSSRNQNLNESTDSAVFSPEKYRFSNHSRPSTANSFEGLGASQGGGTGGGNGFSFKSFSELKAAQSLNASQTGPSSSGNNYTNRRPSFAGSENSSHIIRDVPYSSDKAMQPDHLQFKSPPQTYSTSTSPVPLFNSNPPPPSSQAPPGNANTNLKATSTDEYPTPTAIADKIHAKGYEYRKKGDYQAAVDEYTKALQYDPKHFKALFNRGFAYDKMGKYEKAIEDYSVAITIDRNNAFCYYNRGITYDHVNQLPLAIQDFSKAIELQSDNVDFYHNRAYCFRKLLQYPFAIKDYTTILHSQSKNFKALFNRSLCYEQINQLNLALQDINQALDIQGNQNHPGCYLHRAIIHEKLNLLPNAILDYTKALQCGAQIHPTLHSRAKLYAKLGNYNKAIEDLSRVIETTASTKPKDMNVLFSRAMCYKSLNHYQQAIDDFTGILQQDPSQLLVYNYRGYCYRKLEQNEEAIQDYSMAIRLSPNNVRAYNNRGFLYAKLQMYQEAIRDYTKAIELDPMNSHAYHNRGISYDKVGMIDQAIADFSKVFELDSKQSTMKLTKEERTGFFENELTLNQKGGAVPAGGGGAGGRISVAMDDNDASSVGSGARYRGNVSLETTGHFQREPLFPLQGSQRIPLPANARNAIASNGEANSPQPPMMRSLSVGRGGTLPSKSSSRNLTGSPTNGLIYSPPPAGSKPLTTADLNSPLGKPLQRSLSGVASGILSPSNGTSQYAFSTDGVSNPVTLTRSTSYNGLNAAPSNSGYGGGGIPLPSASGGNSPVPPPVLVKRPSILVKDNPNSTSQFKISLPVGSENNPTSNLILSPVPTSSGGKILTPTPFSPSRTNSSSNLVSPTPVGAIPLPVLSNRGSFSLPSVNDGNNPPAPSAITRALSQSSDFDSLASEEQLSTNRIALTRQPSTNTVNPPPGGNTPPAPPSGILKKPVSVINVTDPVPSTQSPPTSSIAETAAAAVAQSNTNNEEKSNKIKSLAQRFNQIQKAVNSEEASSVPRNNASENAAIGRIRAESSGSAGEGTAGNVNPSGGGGSTGRIAIPNAFNKTNTTSGNTSSNTNNPAKIAIPSLKRPNLFRTPVATAAATTTTEPAAEDNANNQTSNPNNNSNIKAESFLAMIKPSAFDGHQGEGRKEEDQGGGGGNTITMNSTTTEGASPKPIPIPLPGMATGTIPIPGKFSRPNIFANKNNTNTTNTDT